MAVNLRISLSGMGPLIQSYRLIILESGEVKEPPRFLGFCAAS
jgi:hypothetical protein